MSREAVEAAVRAHMPDWWNQIDVDAIVGSFYREGWDPDRDEVAHDMWAMGAGPEHEGCKYGGPDPADGDEENNCATCRAWLLIAADKILAAHHSTEQEKS